MAEGTRTLEDEDRAERGRGLSHDAIPQAMALGEAWAGSAYTA